MDKLLKELKACKEAREWAKGKTWKEVYETCPRGDWLVWLFTRTNPNNLQELALVKWYFANFMRHLMKDERSIKSVYVVLAFAQGKATREELDAASHEAEQAWEEAYNQFEREMDADEKTTDIYADAAYVAYCATCFHDDHNEYPIVAAVRTIAINEDDRPRAQKLTADICRKYLPIEIWNIKE